MLKIKMNLRQLEFISVKGFTLIELLIVVAVIGILATIAIPGYIGIQERSRKSSVVRAAETAVPELQNWLHSAKKIGPQSALIEVDTNGDGRVDSSDMSNSALASAHNTVNGLCSAYVTARWAMFSEWSPWDLSQSLWLVSSSSVAGRITCGHNANGNVILTAQDRNGNTIYEKVVAAD